MTNLSKQCLTQKTICVTVGSGLIPRAKWQESYELHQCNTVC